MSVATLTQPAPARRHRGIVRRRPFPQDGWMWRGDDGTRACRARRRGKPGEGTIVLPDVAGGWSPLCTRIVELACAYVIEDLEYPASEWAGPVPGLQRDDLMTAADVILGLDKHDAIPFHELLAALAEAHCFVGFKN